MNKDLTPFKNYCCNSTTGDEYNFVDSPVHYNNYSVEAFEMMRRIFGTDKMIDFCEINALKYRLRAGSKPNESVETDLKKEKWYLNKAKQLRNERF